MVALRVDKKQSVLAVADLSAKDKVGARRKAVFCIVAAVFFDNLAIDGPDVVGRFAHALDARKAGLGVFSNIPPQARYDGLGGREVAGAEQRKEPAIEIGKGVHLAVHTELIDAGIGAGIGNEDEPVIDTGGEAVSHARSLARRAAN